jgi:tRNA pseudouridine13 synthase
LKRLYPLAHTNDFVFNSSPRDFTVEEIPLYDFAGEGEHAIALVRKKELTTWEMVKILSEHFGIKQREIGYAGLKDKHAMTMQYVSFPAKYEASLAHFSHDSIKILSTTRHTNKIRIGHLKGNRFSLRFKKVLGIQQAKIDSVLDWIEVNGVPNYFGDQRFGLDGNNWETGKAIVEGRYKERNRRTREFLVSAYQSYLFNAWLGRRMEISRVLESFGEAETEQVLGLARGALAGTKSQPHFFKLLSGDVMMHYPFGRIFHADDVAEEAIKFHARDRCPTGLIAGKRALRALGAAQELESNYEVAIKENGSRRYAWIFPNEIARKYLPEKAHYELSFTLQKGAYATNVVDLLRGGNEP